ncbi:hypothetical protein EG328_011888 [Venturia inaequalis]|uniref:pectate lyase n=1 Tax=Venturia inaequalis TaxID=5025 RepID=A0A8H3UMF9_VENIN|nr:hypothetical protein EG328_011888 [Venturia inaequalis]KAE9972800.1 hypothetical protein EG327_009367 [Venturia inaequalis]RDI79402.1 T-complex protein 1 subunit theta [Venturia inaequalis]
MRFASIITGLVAIAQASPLTKRASTSDAATVGYATQNGGTTGGKGGKVTTVTTLAALQSAAAGDTAGIVIISGTISGAGNVKVGSNKSIIGAKGSKVVGIGFTIKAVKNVIIRNVVVSKVLAANGDAIALNKATNVWVDHVDVSSDVAHDKDYYDGLIDVTHACDWVTISNSFIHDHWKSSLVGHSDSNGAEDKGHLTVTYANNYWSNTHSRGPSFRFGTGHVFNNYYENVSDGINTRKGAQLLVESNAFTGSSKPLYSVGNDGFAVATDNDFGGESNTAPKGTLTKVPYTYTKLGAANVKSGVVGVAGATLSF